MATENRQNTNFPDRVNTRKATPNEVAYRDGYLQGRDSEQRWQVERERAKESNGVANGMLIGAILAAVVAAIVGGVTYLNRLNDRPETTTAPTSPEAVQPQSSENQNRETTIIERTIERTQEAIPSAPPQINIEVPNPTQDSTTQDSSQDSNTPANPVAPQSESPTGTADSTTIAPPEQSSGQTDAPAVGQ